MSQAIRVGIIGCGWPGAAHARGYTEAGGFKIVAAADLIPERRKKIATEFGAAKEYTDARELLKDKEIDAVSLCLPTALHAAIAAAAMRSGKHVLCENPPGTDLKSARKISAAAEKSKKILLYSAQRRFGGAEQAAKQAIAKGYAGEIYHARASWMRTRGIPIGTGWFTKRDQSGGGAMIDIGIHMLDLAWHLLGQPRPTDVFAVSHRKFQVMDVEDSAFALIRFDGGKSLELSASWAINQAPQQQGTVCRLYSESAGLDVYTPAGAMLYRNFTADGQSKGTPLPPPRVSGHASMMRHFRDCILGKSQPLIGSGEGIRLMQMIEGIYRSAQTGRSIAIK